MNVGAGADRLLAFALHPAAWAGVLCVTAAFAWWLREPRRTASRRQVWGFAGAMAVLLAATTWPLADLAAHHLLVALVTQRLLLVLAVPPLLLRGLPAPLLARLTRPAAVDAVARLFSRPAPAVAFVTAVSVGTLNVPAVVLQSRSAVARGGFDLLVLAAGIVLWTPVLHPVPGTRTTSALGRAGYLVVQSIVPSFLSIVWIFARHPLYPPFATSGRTLALSPLADQELSGFVAKLGTIFVLWAVAFVLVMRSERVIEQGGDPEPLTWADVERELERAARRDRRTAGRPVVTPAPEDPQRRQGPGRATGGPAGDARPGGG